MAQPALDDLEVVYMWVDGVYVKAGLEKEKAAVLVVMAALSDGSKVVVSAVPGYRESDSELVRGAQGHQAPGLELPEAGGWRRTPGHLGSSAQRLSAGGRATLLEPQDRKRARQASKATTGPGQAHAAYYPLRADSDRAERLRTVFTRWCGDHSYEAASEALERDWDRMVTFYDFPKEHWGHLRTTNPVESPFAALRLRTDAAKRYKRVDRAIAVIWKMLMVAEQRFRRLKAPELIEDVYLGAQYADGIAIESTAEKVGRLMSFTHLLT